MTEGAKKILSEMIDDKFFVVIGVVVIGVAALCTLQNPESLLQSIITGLFGIAVGRRI